MGFASYLGHGGTLVASLADRNGDGRRELVGARRIFGSGWVLDTYLSAAQPSPETVAAPALKGGRVRFAGTFGTGWRGGGHPVAVRPSVAVRGPRLRRAFEGRTAATSAVRERFTVGVPPGRFLRGPRYRYRMTLVNSGALSGTSAVRSFVLHGVNRLRGTRRPERIPGTRRRDRIDARGGGRDVVDCGAGRDVALVDRRDTVRRCERVLRPAPLR